MTKKMTDQPTQNPAETPSARTQAEPTPEPPPTAAVAPEPTGPKWTRMQEQIPATPTPQSEPEPEPVPATGPTPAEKTFTQAELDQILKDRLDRQRKQFEGHDDFKKKAAKLDELEKAQMDEVERLKLELQQAQQGQQVAQQQAEQSAINTALLSHLTEYQTDKGMGIRKDAMGAALKLVDLSKLTYEGGQVSGVEDAVKLLVEQNNFLLEQSRQATATSPTNPARSAPAGTTDKDRQRRYFGGGGEGSFFKPQGNVVQPE